MPTNLQTLYEEHEAFRDAAVEYAQAFIGSTSPKLAREWLESANGISERPSAPSDAKEDGDHPKQLYVTVEDFEWLQEQLADDEPDSREKLEADVREWVDDIGWLLDKETQVADFIAWLDRQAAITNAAWKQLKESWITAHDSLLAENAELRNQVDTLLAAHADDVERLDAMGEGELTRKLDELQEEVEEMQDELKRVWKESEKWKARCAELQAELDKWHKLTEGIVLPDYPMTQYQPNSRADLEAEVHYWLISHVAVSVNVGAIEAEVRKWLDRAEMIGERRMVSQWEETSSQLVNDMNAARAERELHRSKLGECADLAEQIRNVAMGFGDAALVDLEGNVV